jgi:F-type H+-transporting ATPase subunit epsilon
MSERTFQLVLVTPDKGRLVDLPVHAVSALGQEGAFSAWPGHVPFLTDLKPALVSFLPQGATRPEEYFVSGGFIEVLPSKATILADSAERPEEIDAARAERSRLKAAAELQELKEGPKTAQGELEIRKAELKLVRAVARIQTANKHQMKR